jgi:methionyl-tRNA formyltransferase
VNAPVLLLGVDGEITRVVYNRLAREFGPFPAIIEQPISRATLLRIRVRKLGLLAVTSQIAFVVFVRPIIARQGKSRIERVISEHGLDASPIPVQHVSQVKSVNSPETIKLILRADPKVIVVNGTRIISRKVLSSTRAVFINAHAGITPKYRGVHGGYWALYNSDPGHCGVTVHIVDPGIDTGDILGQALIMPTRQDSFVTYPYLQVVAALPILSNVVHSALTGTLQTCSATGDSALWYHPGLLQYLRGIWRGIR